MSGNHRRGMCCEERGVCTGDGGDGGGDEGALGGVGVEEPRGDGHKHPLRGGESSPWGKADGDLKKTTKLTK